MGKKSKSKGGAQQPPPQQQQQQPQAERSREQKQERVQENKDAQLRQRSTASVLEHLPPSASSSYQDNVLLAATSTRPPLAVVLKLVAFSFAVIFLPIMTLFWTQPLFPDEPRYPVIASVVVVHLVLFAYVVVAWREDPHAVAQSSKSR